MALILLIETATGNCSVAIAKEGEVLAVRSSDDGYVHAERLAVYIQECLEEAKIAPAELEAIGVSIGPGSYTGLRVGLSTAKGMAYGLGIPVLPVSTLEAIARVCAKQYPGANCYLSAIDARRSEVYMYALRDSSEKAPMPVILDETPWTSWVNAGEDLVYVCGDGAPKVAEWWSEAQIRETTIRCSAIHLIELAEAAYKRGVWADLAYIEPHYLKPPNVTIPKSMKITGASE